MNARYVLVAATTTWPAITTFVGTTLADHRPGNVVVMGGTVAQSSLLGKRSGIILSLKRGKRHGKQSTTLVTTADGLEFDPSGIRSGRSRF